MFVSCLIVMVRYHDTQFARIVVCTLGSESHLDPSSTPLETLIVMSDTRIFLVVGEMSPQANHKDSSSTASLK